MLNYCLFTLIWEVSVVIAQTHHFFFLVVYDLIKWVCYRHSFISVTVFLISSISSWFCLRVSITLLALLICFHILSTFSISALSILIRVTLNFQCNSNISAISEFSSDTCFDPSIAFFLVTYLVFFCWKPDIMCWWIESELSRPLCDICVNLGRSGLRLMFTVAVGASPPWI